MEYWLEVNYAELFLADVVVRWVAYAVVGAFLGIIALRRR